MSAVIDFYYPAKGIKAVLTKQECLSGDVLYIAELHMGEIVVQLPTIDDPEAWKNAVEEYIEERYM